MAGPLHTSAAGCTADEGEFIGIEGRKDARLMSRLYDMGSGGGKNHPKSRMGIHRHKHKMRAIFRCMSFIALIGVYSFYNHVGNGSNSTAEGLASLPDDGLTTKTVTSSQGNGAVFFNGLDRDISHESIQRRSVSAETVTYTLDENIFNDERNTEENDKTEKDCGDKADPTWFLAFYIIGVLYMFLALAIVCDEFFVPALEEMSSERHLNLSMDVAGATLMAAGGSAPELFTSLFGTFQESEVGFGTIVGSAVFNVLFVIAMCSLLSKEVLNLTWWPLFRDSFCYSIGLGCLAVFVGVTSKDEIVLWEALVLFGMYFVYIIIMYFNTRLYKLITKKELYEDGEASEDNAAETNGGANGESSSLEENGNVDAHSLATRTNVDFRWPSTFRAGVLKLLRDPESWVETAGVGIVSKMAGDVDTVFQEVDIDGDGGVDKEELGLLMEKLDCHVTPEQLDQVFRQLDSDGNGKIDEHEFTKWYIASEERIRSKVKETFDQFDTDKSGTIDRNELRQLLEKLEPRATENDVDIALDAMHKRGNREEISFEEFSEWYTHSLIYEKQKKRVMEEQETLCESLMPPMGEGCIAWIKYIILIPLILTLSLTVPNVMRPGMQKWCYISFILSIAWIGGYSYFMVEWAEIIGNTVGIPSLIMGLTFLAAGTSVPDLLSSVIVARRGEGDMAVSSSIGSNIFDILVGLPLPWIIFIAYPNDKSKVEMSSDGVALNIVILLGMLVFIILAIHWQGWKLTKTLAFLMLLFYAGFLVQAIVLELPLETCK
uniref:EF-hand domain-containing protein n=1 Tax=Helicotheca tamesis TaxID=374047 RepID=A0A7S2MHF8_9STRA|mmetsp:Transcript_16033/g.22001  ORF Transcript_16033/g.22001 Transcript_16033/m.22001 type:complete len:774 (+) Transcript_16033:32-2353(+)